MFGCQGLCYRSRITWSRYVTIEEDLIIIIFPGKTTTICAFIQAAVLLGRSVLVTAHTNSAVDNVLLKLIPLFKDPSAIILRVGSEKSVHPGCQGFTLQSKLEYICSSESSTDDVKYVSAAGIMKDTVSTQC